MFIEYVAFIDEDGGPGHYITKTRFTHVIHDADTRFKRETYTEQANKFGLVPCLVVPDIFRDPSIDVIVYCRSLHATVLDMASATILMGFKQEFYIYHLDSAATMPMTKCPVLWLWNVLTWHLRVPDIMDLHLTIGWMTEPVKAWLDTLIRDLSVMNIPITGYRALDIPGKVRLSIAGVRADDACHRLALVRYVLLRKQDAGIRVSLCESQDQRDRSRDRTSGCVISVAIDSESIPNKLDTTICDCPDKFDSVFGVNRCETLVSGGPWWSYTVGMNTIGKSVNVKTNRLNGEVKYMVDIRPSSQVNQYKYAEWLLPQISPVHQVTKMQVSEGEKLVGLALAIEQSVISAAPASIQPASIQPQPTTVELDKDESENEVESDSAEIDGLTIISHHESEPEHRLAAMARIKRRHKTHTSVTKWLPKLW